MLHKRALLYHLHQQSTFRGMAAPLIWLVAGNVPVLRLGLSFTIQVPSHFTLSNPLHYLNRLIPGSPFLADPNHCTVSTGRTLIVQYPSSAITSYADTTYLNTDCYGHTQPAS